MLPLVRGVKLGVARLSALCFLGACSDVAVLSLPIEPGTQAVIVVFEQSESIEVIAGDSETIFREVRTIRGSPVVSVLSYDHTLEQMGLDSGRVERADGGETRPIPRADRIDVALFEDQKPTLWERVEGLRPAILDFRIARDLARGENCAKKSGCFVDSEKEVCETPCPEPAAPASPAAPARPELGECLLPSTPRIVETRSGTVTVCDAPAIGECPRGAMPRIGFADCVPIGSPCPSGQWPADLPSDLPIVYVSATATAIGSGTRESPFRSIEDAVATAEAGAVIAFGRGVHFGRVDIDRDLVLWGACVEETELQGGDDDTPTGLLETAGARVEIRNLSISASQAIVARQRTSLIVEDASIEGSPYAMVVEGQSVAEVRRAHLSGLGEGDQAVWSLDGTTSISDSLLESPSIGARVTGERGRLMLERVILRGRGSSTDVGLDTRPGPSFEVRSTILENWKVAVAGTASTAAVLEDVAILNSDDGIQMDGGSVSGRRIRFNGIHNSAFIGSLSSGNFADVVATAYDNEDWAFFVTYGRLHLERAVVLDFRAAMVAVGEGALYARDVFAVSKLSSVEAVACDKAAECELERLWIDSDARGNALSITNTPTRVRDLRAEGAQLGVLVVGGTVDIQRALLSRVSEEAVLVAKDGVATLSDVRLGVSADCQRGLLVEDGGRAVLDRFVISAADIGVHLEDEFSSADLRDGAIETAPIGVRLDDVRFDTRRLLERVVFRSVGVPFFFP